MRIGGSESQGPVGLRIFTGKTALIAPFGLLFLVIAVSLGSAFFGAMSDIGNGPSFVVKVIADSTGAHTPSFFGYILKYSLPVLLPILLFTGWVFF